MFFGFENEVSFGSDDTSRTEALRSIYKSYSPKELIIKSDGSIGGYGFEIVSQPMSLAYFNSWDKSNLFFSTLKTGQNCGLHIHVNREAFVSDVHLFKVASFINRSDDSFITKIAGRSDCTYSHKFNKPIAQTIIESKDKANDRYLKVNLNNKHTVEFRLFIGCTKEFELCYRFQFLHALISFTRDNSIANSKSIPKFIEFVNKSGSMYKDLKEFLAKMP
jgi:hypothetical protein